MSDGLNANPIPQSNTIKLNTARKSSVTAFSHPSATHAMGDINASTALQAYGADVMRVWCATADYSRDVSVMPSLPRQ